MMAYVQWLHMYNEGSLYNTGTVYNGGRDVPARREVREGEGQAVTQVGSWGQLGRRHLTWGHPHTGWLYCNVSDR